VPGVRGLRVSPSMFERLIAFSLRQRVLILLGTLALIVGGLYAFTRLPIDAVPDVTNNQLQVLTQAPALAPFEVERYVTVPVELALKSLPDVVEMRSLSRSGISVVTVVFEEHVETYFARQLVLEKLREVEEDLPPGVETPELGPVSTGLGEIFRYVLRDTTGRLSPMELRTVQDWIVRRQLLGVPGLAEVNSLGGQVKQYQVLVDPDRLASYGLTLRDVFDAAAASSGTSGGGVIETGPEQLSVRSVGLVLTEEDLENTVVRTSAGGVPVRLGDMADVTVGPAIRFGAATQDGRGEVVTGFTMQLKGANARVVVSAVKDRIAEIQRTLPDGVVIEPYYDRTALVGRTITTVARNLGEGAVLVIVVLLLLLAHLRAGLILASTIPLAMLFAVICMVLTGQSGNLMSLGAIDFGLVVDGSLIIVENILRLIKKRQDEGIPRGENPIADDEGMRRLVYSGAVEMVKSAKYGVFIIILVYLPIMTLQGIEGKLFRPMALTVTFALIGSLLLSVTYVPVMCSLFLKGKKPIKESKIIEFLHHRYRPVLTGALSRGKIVAAATVALLAVSLVAFTRLGGEFLPRLDEGDLAIQIIRLPSVSLTESLRITGEVERRVKTFPEVVTMVSSTGRAEISTDPMGVEIADSYVILKDRGEWPEIDGRVRTKAELVEAMSEALEDVPGAGVQFLQPIEMRTNELIAGVRGDVAVKVYGEDFDVLNPAAAQIATILSQTEGGADVAAEQTSGFPQLIVRPRREALARYGVSVEDVNTLVATAVGGAKAGEVYEGERRFDVVVRYTEAARGDANALRALLVPTSGGARIPLGDLSDVGLEEGPAQVSREEGSRLVTVQANVRGRDVASFVEEVQGKINTQVDLPPGYRIDYGGQFENLRAASARLTLVVPLALAMIFLLLFQTFGSIRLGVLIFLCVPMAIIGGVAALVVGGMPFSISAGVGFIALFGIAVLNGIVMVAAFRKFEGEGLERREAVLAGADERLRPVVTTATLAALGFVPMLLAHGAGAEVQRPLASVIIGGLITSTLLTLFVLPIVYVWFGGKRADWQAPGAEGVEADTYTPPEHFEDDRPHPASPEPPEGKSAWSGPARPALGVLVMLLLAGGTMQRAAAQTTPPDLIEAQARALAATPALAAQAALVRQQQALRAALGTRPATEFFGSLDKLRPDDLAELETAVGVRQPLVSPGLTRAQRRVGNAAIRQAEAEVAALRRSVREGVTEAYFALVSARAQAVLADSLAALVQAFADASARRRALGDAGALEALQAAVEADRAAVRQAEARGEVVAAEATLRALLGPGTGAPLPPALLPDTAFLRRSDAVPLDTLLARAIATSPEVVAARAARDAARESRRVVAYERRPSLAVEGSHQTIGARPGFLGIGVSIAVPFGRQANRAPDRAAEAAEAAAEAALAQAERSVAVRVQAQAARLAAALASLDSFETRLLPRAQEAYRIALRLRAAGEATYFEVLAAQNALVEARAGYARAAAEAARQRALLDLLLTPEPLGSESF
jgi:heavy metal efflux system protein